MPQNARSWPQPRLPKNFASQSRGSRRPGTWGGLSPRRMMRAGFGSAGPGCAGFFMPETKVLTPLLPDLTDLIAWLKAEEVAGVVIGGLAASLLGRPRLTRDADCI
jgi:hypothetical protein